MQTDFNMYGGEISGNTANSGGGISIRSGNFIMHSGLIRGNEAITGGGGGISISDAGILALSADIRGGTISGNTAVDGGGIHAINLTALTTSTAVIFSGNTANAPHDFFLSPEFGSGFVSQSCLWGLGPSGSVANIQWGSTSIAGAHLLNNYDIGYVDFPISYQVVTFDPNGGSFADTALSQIQADGQSQWRWISQAADAGVTNPLPAYSLAFDTTGNLQNLPLPRPTKTDYTFGGWFNSEAEANDLTSEDGRVQSTDSVTNDASRTLWARWTPAPPAGGGGGSPTGNATITGNATVTGGATLVDPPIPPEIPETPGYAEAPAIITLLFVIGIAAFAYRRVEEVKEKEE